MDLRIAGVYLPGILLFYRYTQSGDWCPLKLGFLSILGAVLVHGILRNVFGPGGPEKNPLEKTTGIQRFLVLMTTVGPAKHFADTYRDVALNARSYWNLLHPIRKWFWLLAIVLVLAVFPYTTYVSLVEIFPLLVEVPFAVKGLYIALVAWVLQNFVIWGRYPAVYLLEQDPSRGYNLSPDAGVFSPETDAPQPNRPIKWMALREVHDTHILQVLRKKAYPVSSLLIAFYICRERSKDGHGHASVNAVSEMWGASEDVSDRLRALSENGLTKKAGPGLYQITATGKAYLSGEIPASKFEDESA